MYYNDPQKELAIEAWARHIEATIKPNIYAVGTLIQATFNGHMIQGNRDTYERMARHFVDRLSCLTYGKTNFERHGKRLPVAVTIEGLTGKRRHLNFLINKPDWKDEVDFEQHMIDEWNILGWVRRDLYISHRTGDCVRYSLKEGPDSLLFTTR
jgi:hypothetical protein